MISGQRSQISRMARRLIRRKKVVMEHDFLGLYSQCRNGNTVFITASCRRLLAHAVLDRRHCYHWYHLHLTYLALHIRLAYLGQHTQRVVGRFAVVPDDYPCAILPSFPERGKIQAYRVRHHTSSRAHADCGHAVTLCPHYRCCMVLAAILVFFLLVLGVVAKIWFDEIPTEPPTTELSTPEPTTRAAISRRPCKPWCTASIEKSHMKSNTVKVTRQFQDKANLTTMGVS